VNVINEMDNISTIVEEDEDEYCDIAIEMQELNEITTRLSGSIQILNIAANGFDPKYFEKQDYCILNVISRAYCTAIKQFYSGGNVDELDKLMVNNENIYRLPVLDFKLSVNMNNDNYSVEKKIIKIPRVAKGRYQYPEHGYKIFKEEFDEVDLIKDTSRIFKNRLPQKVILHSPVYEMFINALSYMSKKEEDFHIVLHVEKSKDLIKITIRNKLKEGFVIDEKELQRIEDSAGLGANRLFFRNIGGHFEFEYDTFSMEAVAKTIINLTELNKY